MSTAYGKPTFAMGHNFVPRLTQEEQTQFRKLAKRAMFGGTGDIWRRGRNLHDALDAGDHKTARFYAEQLEKEDGK